MISAKRDIDETMRRKIAEALDNAGADIPADDVFAELRAHHEKGLEEDRRRLQRNLD